MAKRITFKRSTRGKQGRGLGLCSRGSGLLRTAQRCPQLCHLLVSLLRKTLGPGAQGWGHSLLSFQEGARRSSIRRPPGWTVQAASCIFFYKSLALFVSYAKSQPQCVDLNRDNCLHKNKCQTRLEAKHIYRLISLSVRYFLFLTRHISNTVLISLSFIIYAWSPLALANSLDLPF